MARGSQVSNYSQHTMPGHPCQQHHEYDISYICHARGRRLRRADTNGGAFDLSKIGSPFGLSSPCMQPLPTPQRVSVYQQGPVSGLGFTLCSTSYELGVQGRLPPQPSPAVSKIVHYSREPFIEAVQPAAPSCSLLQTLSSAQFSSQPQLHFEATLSEWGWYQCQCTGPGC